MQLNSYIHLMRLNKPIGILLLLWPTLWAIWFASQGHPMISVTVIFIAGVILMRSAGCIINDVADRNFDAHVSRTQSRPLATQQISLHSALLLFIGLCCIAFCLVLQLNHLTIMLSFIGVTLAIIYPYLKRITHLPQFGLGLAFAWSVPMAFAAVNDSIPSQTWWVFAAAVIWPVIYDTMYAMVDQEDDLKIGIKSTAILFNQATQPILIILKIIFLILLGYVGMLFNMKIIYYFSLVIAALLFLYQQFLIKNKQPAQCFRAFQNNHWVGLIIFIGIVLSDAV